MRMIDNITLFVIQEGIPVIIEGDMIHDFRHRGVIDFDTNDTNKLPIMIDGDIIGDHAGSQILCNIRRQPDTVSGCFGNSEPDQ